MLTRINIIEIVLSHFRTLRGVGQEKGIAVIDFILFLLVPIISAFLLAFYNIGFKSLTSDIITAISILAGFLFNLLAIIYTSLDKIKINGLNTEIRKQFVLELHSNISYNILLSIFIIPLLLMYKLEVYSCWFDKTLIGINYFLLFSFFLTLLMVLKRIFILLDSSANDDNAIDENNDN